MSRLRKLFDNDWKFYLGDQRGAFESSFDDSSWRTLDLPHDWSIQGEFDENHPTGGDGGYLPAGIGWYRKHFKRPEGEVILLEFDGVYQNCDVWLNGSFVGHHNYGYTGFEYDLTALLEEGENIISIKVDNSDQPNSRWYTGSGIYRHVWLTGCGQTRVKHWGDYVTAEINDQGDAVVTARAELTAAASVSFSVLDPQGRKAGFETLVAKKKQTAEIKISQPHLWSIENPVMYTLITSVITESGSVDEVTTPFGIRSILFDKDKGFSINGVFTKLNGVCIHHDGGSAGAAVPEILWERRLILLKEMGCNAIRMAHNPPAPELLDLCDKMGFLVMDEAFDEWRIFKWKNRIKDVQTGYGQFFDEDSDQDLIDMIRRDRNHPSIVLWSIGNEIPEQASPDGWKTASRFRDICHVEDPTRPVTLACDNIKADHRRSEDSFLRSLDVIGVNYVSRWRKHAETKYAWERHHYPDKIFIGAENGAIPGVRGEYNFKPSEDKWWSSPYYSVMIRTEQLLKDTMVNDFICGDFMWTGIDYLGESRWPNKNAASGVIDMCGFPKDGYYLYQSIWTDTPMIHLLPHWNWPDKKEEIIPVVCYTNCATVELFLNGRSMGTKAYEFPIQGMTEEWLHFDKPLIHSTTSDLHLVWDVPYQPGTIKAVGRDRYGAVICEYELSTTGSAAAVTLEIDKKGLTGIKDVAHCVIKIMDEKGLVVPDADNEITLSVEGSGILLGLDNGKPDDRTRMQSPVRKVQGGQALALIQSLHDSGEIKISVTSPGLKASTKNILINPKR